jgi:UDP-glucuronate decarboxylase
MTKYSKNGTSLNGSLNHKPRKVLVTGGAGFIGTNLIKQLLERGDHVTCLDNLQTGSFENLIDFILDDKYKNRLNLVQHDIVNPYYFDVDEIYNLACAASPPAYQKDPTHTLKTCTNGTLNGLNAAHRAGAKFLQASTSEIYGDPTCHPQSETYWGNVNPYGPRACYDEGKRVSEAFCYSFKSKVDIRICRIFNTYGPFMRDNDGRVISNFINSAINGEDITIYGDGEQTRSFCYVADLVNGIMRLMDSQESFEHPINLGNPDERTVKDVADLIIELTDSKVKIKNLPLPTDDPTRRKPDIQVAKNRLGWEPKISLTEGLIKTIDHFSSANRKQNHFQTVSIS